MRQRELNTSRWRRLGLAVLILVMSLTLAVGSAFGRYRTELKKGVLWFQTKSISGIYLWGEKNESGGYDTLPGTWTLTNTGGELAFTITNGTSLEKFAQNDLWFTICVAATSAVEEEEITLSLQLDDEDGKVYQATPVAIEENSVAYEQFGSGWVYHFYDEDGEKFSGMLQGGKMSEFSATLICQGSLSQPDAGMLQIQITAASDE